MNTIQLLERVQFVIDANGNQSAVLLKLTDWEQLLTILEDLEDENDIDQARKENEEEIPWEQAKVELGLNI